MKRSAFFLLSFLFILIACRKEDKPPQFSVYLISGSNGSFRFGMDVSDAGEPACTFTGLVFSDSPLPTVANTLVSADSVGQFHIDHVELGSQLYVRAVALRRSEIFYSPQLQVGVNELLSLEVDGKKYQIAGNHPALPWSDQLKITGADSYTDGIANTFILSSEPWAVAAKYCNQLNEGGYADWYLPAYNELKGIVNTAASGQLSLSGRFWSSTESGAGFALAFEKGNNVELALFKDSDNQCLCVRRAQ